MRLLQIFLFSIFLISCATFESAIYYKEKIPNDRKIIAVPITNIHIAKEIKDLFRNSGWTLLSSNPATRETKKTATGSSSKEFGEAYYQLYYTSRAYDICVLGGKAITFEIVIVDLITMQEVYSVNGNDCENAVFKKIAEELKPFI